MRLVSIRFTRKSCFWLALLLAIPFVGSTGCIDFTERATSNPIQAEPKTPDQPFVWAQGKLLPATGIIQITGIPGDRLDGILVKPGDPVSKGQPLVQLASEVARQGELNLAQDRLSEAKDQFEAKRVEASLKLQTAMAQQSQTEAQIRLAQEQASLAEEGDAQVASSRENLLRMKRLQEDPRTKVMVGTIEYEQKQLEFNQAEAKQRQAKLMAKQALENARLAAELAEQQVAAAKKGVELVDSASSLKSAEAQVALLQQQLDRTKLVAPCDGVVLSVTSDVGEAVLQLPILELADVSKMVCRAEVHESDLRRVNDGCRVEIQSSALAAPIHGTVYRIDRMVGNPEMRIPDPLAKTDFRAIPVWIAIDESDCKEASQFIQLQVQVSIQTR